VPSCGHGVSWNISCMDFSGRSVLELEYDQPDGTTLRRTVSLQF
jgi:hypothetical protein